MAQALGYNVRLMDEPSPWYANEFFIAVAGLSIAAGGAASGADSLGSTVIPGTEAVGGVTVSEAAQVVTVVVDAARLAQEPTIDNGVQFAAAAGQWYDAGSGGGES